MNKIFEALEVPHTGVRENAMQILVELARLQYESMEFYLQKIAIATSQATNNDEQSVGTQGIEFWTTLTEEEIYREKKKLVGKNYIRNNSSDLVSLMLQNISKITIEDGDEDDDEVGVQMSSGVCLQKISLLIGSQVLPQVVTFVSSNITSADWRARYAAVLSLGIITEGPDKPSFN